MNIINNDDIFKKYFKAVSEKFKRTNEDITEIVIHGSGGHDTAKGIIDWMAAGGLLPDGSNRIENYKKGISLFHSEIDRNGDLYNILSPLYWCYHSSSGRHDKCTIGIELVSAYPDNKGIFTYQQYDSLFEIIDSYKGIFPIKTIVGHGFNKKKYSDEYKNCPGVYFEWNKLQKKFDLKQIANECYEI
jgi:hypothetical protein